MGTDTRGNPAEDPRASIEGILHPSLAYLLSSVLQVPSSSNVNKLLLQNEILTPYDLMQFTDDQIADLRFTAVIQP